jgi:hypothetical protein
MPLFAKVTDHAPPYPIAITANTGVGSKWAYPVDTNGDGVMDSLGLDTTGDGKLDALGLPIDTVGDSTADSVAIIVDVPPQGLGLDTNGDGKINVWAIAVDTNGDGQPDRLAVDTTGDGTPDMFGFAVDTKGDGVADGVAIDLNRDGKVDTIIGCLQLSTDQIDFMMGQFENSPPVSPPSQFDMPTSPTAAAVQTGLQQQQLFTAAAFPSSTTAAIADAATQLVSQHKRINPELGGSMPEPLGGGSGDRVNPEMGMFPVTQCATSTAARCKPELGIFPGGGRQEMSREELREALSGRSGKRPEAALARAESLPNLFIEGMEDGRCKPELGIFPDGFGMDTQEGLASDGGGLGGDAGVDAGGGAGVGDAGGDAGGGAGVGASSGRFAGVGAAFGDAGVGASSGRLDPGGVGGGDGGRGWSGERGRTDVGEPSGIKRTRSREKNSLSSSTMSTSMSSTTRKDSWSKLYDGSADAGAGAGASGGAAGGGGGNNSGIFALSEIDADLVASGENGGSGAGGGAGAGAGGGDRIDAPQIGTLTSASLAAHSATFPGAGRRDSINEAGRRDSLLSTGTVTTYDLDDVNALDHIVELTIDEKQRRDGRGEGRDIDEDQRVSDVVMNAVAATEAALAESGREREGAADGAKEGGGGKKERQACVRTNSWRATDPNEVGSEERDVNRPQKLKRVHSREKKAFTI